MTSFYVFVDTKHFEQTLNELEKKQLPYASMLAANEAAYGTMQTLRTAANLFIDRPTPFTVQSIRYRKATKAVPAAEIYLSGDAAKGTPPAKYLTITRGGVRGQRRSERVLARAGLISDDEGLVPGKDLELNRYGNVPAPRMVQALSQIKAFGEEGFRANATARSRARNAKKRKARYFWSRGDHVPRGIWERYGRGGRQIRPLALVVKLPSYGKTFDFVDLAKAEALRRYLAAWPRAWARALATARR